MTRNTYDLAFHLAKIEDPLIKSMYRKIHDFCGQQHSLTYTSDYTKLNSGNKWFARLYGQKNKMAIDVKRKYDDYPFLRTIERGNVFKDGKTINFHIHPNADVQEAIRIINTASSKKESVA